MGRNTLLLGLRRDPVPRRFATLAAANAISVAALHCNQTIFRTVAESFPASCVLSLVPTMTLAGYASGVALIAFGPAAPGRPTLECHIGFLVAALIAASIAPNALALAAASFFVGVGAAAAPRLLASAAQLVQPAAAGGVIGRVICGSLVAILCVRLFADGLAAIAGWRSVFLVAAASMFALAVLLRITRAADRDQLAVAAAPDRLRDLWRSNPLLRRVAAQQAALFAAYNASWMTALVALPAHERPLAVIVGSSAGIAAALVAARLSNRVGQHNVATVGAAAILVAGALLLPAAYGVGTSRALPLLAGMALVDAGLQLALVANQTRVQALAPAARTRLAAMLTISGFLGGAVGAGAASWLWHALGWQPAIGLVAAGGCIGFLCSFSTGTLEWLRAGWRRGAEGAARNQPERRFALHAAAWQAAPIQGEMDPRRSTVLRPAGFPLPMHVTAKAFTA